MDPIDKKAKFADTFASAFALDPTVATKSKAPNDDPLDEKDNIKYTKEEPVLNTKIDTKHAIYKNIEYTDDYTKSEKSTVKQKYLPLLSIPDVALEKILSYLPFDQVAQMRVICRRIDWICQAHLNRGFRAAEQFHAKCLKQVRAKLPRRESSRREHPYSRHCDILTAIGTRISLLAMTFCKYIDVELCCFIPGKVIDEIFRVLRICNEKNPPRAFEVLQELRDISSMAMEHFDEKIVPTFKVNPHSPAAAAAAVASTYDPIYNSVSPSKILSGSYLSITGPSYLGVQGISSPVFGTLHSTPKLKHHPLSLSPRETEEIGKIAVVTKVCPAEKSLLDKIIKNHKELQTTVKRQRRFMKKMQKEMALQRDKIEGLEKVINNQETLIVNQTEKLKEHDNLFAGISKIPKEQTKIGLLSCKEKELKKTTKYETLPGEPNVSYIPQYILQPPLIDKSITKYKNVNHEGDAAKSVTKYKKRKLQDCVEDQTNLECKRTRSNLEESELSILRCGALAAIANKNK